MRRIKIRNINKKILNNEHCEDAEYFDYLCSEAAETKALSYFGIKYDDTRSILEVPDIFDFDKAIEIVNLYLAYVEDDIPTTSLEAMRYDAFTKPFRGADDGTFDYAGTFVISILTVLQEVTKK